MSEEKDKQVGAIRMVFRALGDKTIFSRRRQAALDEASAESEKISAAKQDIQDNLRAARVDVPISLLVRKLEGKVAGLIFAPNGKDYGTKVMYSDAHHYNANEIVIGELCGQSLRRLVHQLSERIKIEDEEAAKTHAILNPPEPDKYPEHTKMKALEGRNQIVGEFLEWLDNSECHVQKGTEEHKNIFLAHYPTITHDDDGNQLSEPYESNGISSWNESTEELIARFFDIDIKAFRDEKEAMVEELREANKETTPPEDGTKLE